MMLIQERCWCAKISVFVSQFLHGRIEYWFGRLYCIPDVGAQAALCHCPTRQCGPSSAVNSCPVRAWRLACLLAPVLSVMDLRLNWTECLKCKMHRYILCFSDCILNKNLFICVTECTPAMALGWCWNPGLGRQCCPPCWWVCPQCHQLPWGWDQEGSQTLT